MTSNRNTDKAGQPPPPPSHKSSMSKGHEQERQHQQQQRTADKAVAHPSAKGTAVSKASSSRPLLLPAPALPSTGAAAAASKTTKDQKGDGVQAKLNKPSSKTSSVKPEPAKAGSSKSAVAKSTTTTTQKPSSVKAPESTRPVPVGRVIDPSTPVDPYAFDMLRHGVRYDPRMHDHHRYQHQLQRQQQDHQKQHQVQHRNATSSVAGSKRVTTETMSYHYDDGVRGFSSTTTYRTYH